MYYHFSLYIQENAGFQNFNFELELLQWLRKKVSILEVPVGIGTRIGIAAIEEVLAVEIHAAGSRVVELTAKETHAVEV